MGSDAEAGLRFDHEVIDPDPPSGDTCCLDVLATGDINGDGADDVVIGSEHSDGASWYRNPGGDAPAGPWQRFPIGAGDFTTDGETADLDGDGDVDVADELDRGRERVEWWEQVGDPTSTDGWVRHDIGADWAHDLLLADVNADHQLDVIAAHPPPAEPPGRGSRRPRRGVDVTRDRGSAGRGRRCSRLDADEDLDLVLGPCVYFDDDGSATHGARSDLPPTGWKGQAGDR